MSGVMPSGFTPIPKYPEYAISRSGQVWSLKRQRPLRISIGSYGYPFVNLRCGSRRSPCKLHTLLLETFVGARPVGMECRHLDGDPQNNALSNLKWGTKKENAQDTIRHGRHAHGVFSGESHPLAFLTREMVDLIRSYYADGVESIEIATMTGLQRSHVYSIVRGRIWNKRS